MSFRNGDTVILTDSAYGTEVKGALHLPDLVMYGNGRRWSEPQKTYGGYGVHTLILPNGSRFRTEGRLS